MEQMEWSANYAAMSIFAITLVFSLIGLVNRRFLEGCMLHPYSIVRNHKLYTVLTSGLVHANISHLLFNMLTFYFFAFALEKYYLGSVHFTMLYFVGLLLCDIPSILQNRNVLGYYSLGASGAISAVLFCYIIYAPKTGISVMFIPIAIPAYIFGILYLVYTTYASQRQSDGINHSAHLYGALTGIVMAFILNFAEARQVLSKIMEH